MAKIIMMMVFLLCCCCSVKQKQTWPLIVTNFLYSYVRCLPFLCSYIRIESISFLLFGFRFPRIRSRVLRLPLPPSPPPPPPSLYHTSRFATINFSMSYHIDSCRCFFSTDDDTHFSRQMRSSSFPIFHWEFMLVLRKPKPSNQFNSQHTHSRQTSMR